MAIQMLYQSDLGQVDLRSIFASFEPDEYLRDDGEPGVAAADGQPSAELEEAFCSSQTKRFKTDFTWPKISVITTFSKIPVYS